MPMLINPKDYDCLAYVRRTNAIGRVRYAICWYNVQTGKMSGALTTCQDATRAEAFMYGYRVACHDLTCKYPSIYPEALDVKDWEEGQ